LPKIGGSPRPVCTSTHEDKIAWVPNHSLSIANGIGVLDGIENQARVFQVANATVRSARGKPRPNSGAWTKKRHSLGDIEPVAHTVYGCDAIATRVHDLDLSAQILDVTIDGAVAHVTEVRMQAIQQLRPREDAPGSSQQQAQHAEFEQSEGEPAAAPCNPQPFFID
jgi:hypothetical protein